MTECTCLASRWTLSHYERMFDTVMRAGFRRDQIRRGLGGRTIEERDRVLDSLERWLNGIPLSAATRPQVEEWLDSLALTPRSRACYLSTVHNFYSWAVDEGFRPDDPTRTIRRPRLPRLIPRPISDRDLRSAMAQAPPRMRAWLCLAAFQGFRCKEIAGLTRDDVLEHRDPPVILVGEGKGGHQAVLPLNPETWASLLRLPMPKRGYIFTTQEGRRFNDRTVSIYGARYLRDLGIDATMHQLRHRFGTAVWAATKDMRVTQELLRHADPGTTAGYVAYDHRLAQQAVAHIHEIEV